MSFSQILLYPLSIAYGVVLVARNFCFDSGLLKQRSFSLPVISVGNITVGGTGKTPMVEFIVKALKPRYRIAVLSRGYKRNTHGFRVAGNTDTPDTIGDEAYQVKQKFSDLTVAVCEKRCVGIDELAKQDVPPDIIILDDAFQHRYVKPGLSVLMIDYNRPLWKDCPFPGGRMREFACASKRANVVVFSKCPHDLSQHNMEMMVKKIKGATLETTFFTGISYGAPANIASGVSDNLLFCNNPSFVLVTGIASSLSFVQYLCEQGSIKKHFAFADHHNFSQHDIDHIEKYASEHNHIIITTEKDAVRLAQKPLSQWFKDNTFFIPITTLFVDGREKEYIYQIYKYLANS